MKRLAGFLLAGIAACGFEVTSKPGAALDAAVVAACECDGRDVVASP